MPTFEELRNQNAVAIQAEDDFKEKELFDAQVETIEDPDNPVAGGIASEEDQDTMKEAMNAEMSRGDSGVMDQENIESDINSTEFTDMTYDERVKRSLIGGSYQVVEGIGDLINYTNAAIPGMDIIKGNRLGNWIKNESQEKQKEYENWLPEEMKNPDISFDTFTNPLFWTDNVASGIPYLASFIAVGGAGASLAKGAGRYVLKSMAGNAAKEAAAQTVKKGLFNSVKRGLGKMFGEASVKAETGLLHGGTRLGKLIDTTGKLTAAGETTFSTVGGGMFSNQMTSLLQASQALEQAKAEKDEFGRRVFDDDQVRQIAANTHSMNTAYMALDMLSWGMSFGKLGERVMSMPIKGMGEVTKLGAKTFGKNTMKFMKGATKGAAVGTFEGLEETYQEVFEEWTARRAIEMERGGEDFSFVDFVTGMAGGKEWDKYKKMYDSDEMAGIKSVSFALGALSGGGKAFVDGMAEDQARLNERGEIVNEHVASAQQLKDLKYLQRRLVNNTLKDAVLDGKQEIMNRTIAGEWAENGLISNDEIIHMQESLNEFTELHNEAVSLTQEGSTALFTKMVEKRTMEQDIEDINERMAESDRKIDNNDALTPEQKQALKDSKRKGFEEDIKMKEELIEKNKQQMQTLIMGKVRSKTKDKSGLSKAEAEKYLDTEDEVNDEIKEEPKGIIEKVKNFFTGKVDQAKEAMNIYSEDEQIKTSQEVKDFQAQINSTKSTIEEVEPFKDEQGNSYSVDDEGNWTVKDKNGKESAIDGDDVLEIYNQNEIDRHSAKFDARNVYNQDVANNILARSKAKNVKSRPVSAALAMVQLAGREPAELKAIIEDQLLNARTSEETEFWQQAKDDYGRMSSAELKSLISATEQLDTVGELQELAERQDEYDQDKQETVDQQMDDYIDAFVENFGTTPSDEEMADARSRFEDLFTQNNARPEYNPLTINRGASGGTDIERNLTDGTNINQRFKHASGDSKYVKTETSRDAIDWMIRDEAERRAHLGDHTQENLDNMGPAISGDVTGHDFAKQVVINKAVSKMFPGAKVQIVNSLYDQLGSTAMGYAIGATAYINSNDWNQGKTMMHELSHVYASMAWDEPATQARLKFLMKNDKLVEKVMDIYSDSIDHSINKDAFEELDEQTKEEVANELGLNYTPGQDIDEFIELADKIDISIDGGVDSENLAYMKEYGLISEMPLENQQVILEEMFVGSMENQLNNQYTELFTEKEHLLKNKMFTRKWWFGIEQKAKKHEYDVKEVERALLDGKEDTMSPKDLKQYILDNFVKSRNDFTGVSVGRFSKANGKAKKVTPKTKKVNAQNKDSIAKDLIVNLNDRAKLKKKKKAKKFDYNEWKVLKNIKENDERAERKRLGLTQDEYIDYKAQQELNKVNEDLENEINKAEEEIESQVEADVIANISEKNSFDFKTIARTIRAFVKSFNKEIAHRYLTGKEKTSIGKIVGRDFAQKLRNMAKARNNAVDFINDIEMGTADDIVQFSQFLVKKYGATDAGRVDKRAYLQSIWTSLTGMNHDYAMNAEIDKNGNYHIVNSDNMRNKGMVQRAMARLMLSPEDAGRVSIALRKNEFHVTKVQDRRTFIDILSDFSDKKAFSRDEQMEFIDAMFNSEIQADRVVDQGILIVNGIQKTVGEVMHDSIKGYLNKHAKGVDMSIPGNVKSVAEGFHIKGASYMKGFTNAVVHANQKFIANDTVNSAEGNSFSVNNKQNAMTLKFQAMEEFLSDGKKTYSQFTHKFIGKALKQTDKKKKDARKPMIERIYDQIKNQGRVNVQMFGGVNNKLNGVKVDFKRSDSKLIAVNEFMMYLNGEGDTFLNTVGQNADSNRKFYTEAQRINMKLKEHSEENLIGELTKRLMLQFNMTESEAKSYFVGKDNPNSRNLRNLEKTLSNNRHFLNKLKFNGLQWNNLSRDAKTRAIKQYHYSSMFASMEMAEIMSPGATLDEVIKRSKGNTSPFIPLDKNLSLDLIVMDDFKDGRETLNDAVSYILPEDATRVQQAYGDAFPVGSAFKFVGFNQNQFGNTDYTKSMTFVLTDEFVKEHPKYANMQKLLRKRRQKFIDGGGKIAPFGMGMDSYLPIIYSQSGVKMEHDEHKKSRVDRAFLERDNNTDEQIEEQLKKISEYNDFGDKFVGSKGGSFGVQGLMDKDFNSSVLPVQFQSALMIGTNKEMRDDLNMSEGIQEKISNIMDHNRSIVEKMIDKDVDEFLKNSVSENTDAEKLNLLGEGISRNHPFLKHFGINNITNKLKKAGNKLSTAGTVAYESSDFLYDEKLKGYDVENGKVKPFEIRLPASMKGKVSKGDVIFVTRIPSHGIQTTGMAVVRGFNTEGQGQKITASNEFSRIVGSDNDGDALYVNTKFKNPKGKAQNEWNDVMKLMEEFYSRPEMIDVLKTGINMKELVEAAEARMAKTGVEYKDRSQKKLPFAPYERAVAQDETVGAKNLVGVAANIHSVANFFTAYNVKSKIEFSLDGKSLASSFKDTQDGSTNLSQVNSNSHKTAMLMNIVLDNANNHDADVLNVNPQNLANTALMLRLGFDFGDIGLINNSRMGRIYAEIKAEINSPLYLGDKSINAIRKLALERAGLKEGKAVKRITSSDINSDMSSIAILNLMQSLDSANGDVSKVTKIMSGHNNLSSNYFLLEKRISDLEKVLDEGGKQFGLGEIKNNPVIKRYLRTAKSAVKINKGLSATYNKFNQDIFKNISKNINPYMSEEQMMSMSRHLDIINNSRLLNMNNFTKEELEKKAYNAIFTLGSDPAYRNSTLLKEAIKPIRTNKQIMFVKSLFNHESGVTEADFDLVRAEFSELDPEIQEGLIANDLLQNGHGEGGYSFIFPKEIMMDMSNKADKQLENKNKKITRSKEGDEKLKGKVFSQLVKANPDLVLDMQKDVFKDPNSDSFKIVVGKSSMTKGGFVTSILNGNNPIVGVEIPSNTAFKKRKLYRWQQNNSIDEILNKNNETLDSLTDLGNSSSLDDKTRYDSIVREILAGGEYKATNTIVEHKPYSDLSGLVTIPTSDAKANKGINIKKEKGAATKSKEKSIEKAKDKDFFDTFMELEKVYEKAEKKRKSIKKKATNDKKKLSLPNKRGGKKKVGRASKQNIDYFKYQQELTKDEYFAVKKKSNEKSYQKYLVDRAKALKVFNDKISNGKVQQLSDSELESLYLEVASLDGLAGSVASTPLSIEKASREAVIQSQLTGVQRGTDDMTSIHKWLGSNNITSKLPGLQKLVKDMEVMFNKFLRERDKYYRRIDTVTNALYKEKFGKTAWLKKVNPFASKDVYEQLYGNLIVVEKGKNKNREYKNMKLKPRAVVEKELAEGKISKAEMDFYNEFTSITKEFADFNESKNGLREDYIPHTVASKYEAYANRGLLGVYMNSKNSASKLGSVVVTGFDPLTQKEVTQKFKKFEDAYKALAEHGDKHNVKALNRYRLVRAKAEKFYDKGTNEDGSKLKLDRAEVDTLLDQGALNRFEKSRSASAEDMPSMDLNKAITSYVHTALFTNGNENVKGFNSMQQTIDGLIATYDLENKVNAKAYVQKVWKDKFLSGVNPTTIVGKTGDKAIKAGITFTLFKALGLNYGIAVGNAIVGKYQNIRNAGGKTWAKGEKRFWGLDKMRSPKEFIRHMKKVQNILRNNGFMAQNMYDEINIEEKHNVFNMLETIALAGMIYSEKWIQGAHYLGLITDEEWNSYDDDGNLKKSRVGVTPERQTKIEDEVKKSHGRGYQVTDQRLVSLYSFGQAFAQFSRYIPTMFNERFGEEEINIYGNKEVGSMREFGRMARSVADGSVKPDEFKSYYEGLEPHRKKAMKSALVGMGIMVMAGIVVASGDDDDDRVKYAKGLISDANVANHPSRLIKKTKPPVVYTAEKFTRDASGMLGL